MYIELKIDEKLYNRIKEILKKYHEAECQCIGAAPCCLTRLSIMWLDGEDRVVDLTLSTGNGWGVEKRVNPLTGETTYVLYYGGSRYGFAAQTPFINSGIKIIPKLVYPNGMEVHIIDNEVARRVFEEITAYALPILIDCKDEWECRPYIAPILKYETSAPPEWALLPTERVITVEGDNMTCKAAAPMYMKKCDPKIPVTIRLLSCSF